MRLTIKELLALAPTPTWYYGGYTPDPWNQLSYRTLLVVADVNETVTGIIYSGSSTVDVKTDKYQLTFLPFSPDNYKPGLLYTAYVSDMTLSFFKLFSSHFLLLSLSLYNSGPRLLSISLQSACSFCLCCLSLISILLSCRKAITNSIELVSFFS